MLLLQTLLVWNFTSLDAGEEQRGGREKRDRGGEQRGQPQRRGPAAPHGKAMVGGERERRCLTAVSHGVWRHFCRDCGAGNLGRARRGRPGARVPRSPRGRLPQVPRCGAGPAPVLPGEPRCRARKSIRGILSPPRDRDLSSLPGAACRGHPSIPELGGRAACPTPSQGFVLALLRFFHPERCTGAMLYCTALRGPGDGQ